MGLFERFERFFPNVCLVVFDRIDLMVHDVLLSEDTGRDGRYNHDSPEYVLIANEIPHVLFLPDGRYVEKDH